MKLLNKTNEYYIAVAIGLLFIGSFVVASRVLYLVNKEINDRMLFEKSEIENQLIRQPQIAESGIIIGDRIEIIPIYKLHTLKLQLKDTSRYDPYLERTVPYRQLTYEKPIGGKFYSIRILKRLPEGRDMFSGLAITIALIAVDVIFCFYFLNRWFSRRIWSPFYNALEVLKKFDLRKGGHTVFTHSSVEEFDTLNKELVKLTDKVSRDYQNLKEFTENMSHETQTPLAIIRSKLDIMLQSENLSEAQTGQIKSSLDAVNRLSRMNKSLIMLTRIDNDQYADTKLVNLGGLLRKQLQDMEIFVESKRLVVEENVDEQRIYQVNEQLAEILISNLLSNAIKYNTTGGRLSVKLEENTLVIANSGDALEIQPDQIFERFKKGQQKDSVGLGLAIVKKICDHFNSSIQYQYENGMHSFVIVFPFDIIVG
ncbi:MAG: HAMP domain-containing sensor histidine kinase [Bacteroidetes bacterium]|nr:HAMP domain-containing sensor histidine kinase [Bacteroidota bacterium]